MCQRSLRFRLHKHRQRSPKSYTGSHRLSLLRVLSLNYSDPCLAGAHQGLEWRISSQTSTFCRRQYRTSAIICLSNLLILAKSYLHALVSVQGVFQILKVLQRTRGSVFSLITSTNYGLQRMISHSKAQKMLG